jgi:hypothetical protein
MEELHDSSFGIPLPQPLPTELAELRDNSNLMEDVWITPSSQDVPRWLGDPNVREGIKAMHKVDRCIEEERRLRKEADNLCRWWGREIASVELALRDPESKLLTCSFFLLTNDTSIDASIFILLRQRHENLLSLKARWVNPMVSLQRFESYISYARLIADHLSQDSMSLLPTWNQPIIVMEEPSVDSDDSTTDMLCPGEESEYDRPLPCDSIESVFTDILVEHEDCDDGTICEDVSERFYEETVIPVIWALPVSDCTPSPSYL